MALQDVLSRIPGLGGYLAGQQNDQQTQMGQLQQVGALQSLLNSIQMEPLKKQMLQAQIAEHQQKAKTAAMINSLSPDQLKDPTVLRQLGVHDPRFMAEADRLEKLKADAALLDQMKGTQTPVQRLAMPAGAAGTPSQDEAAAVQALTASGQKGSVQILPQGVQPDLSGVQSTRTGGIFDALTQSENPQIANQAKQYKAALEKAGPSIPAQYWQTLAKGLSDKETALLNRPVKEPQVKAIIGKDGKPVYSTDFIGATPAAGYKNTQGVDPASANLHGEPYISTLDPTMQNLVKKVVTYDLSPKDLSSRTGERKDLLAHAIQADPNFSPAKYGIRYGVMQDFTKGKVADNIVAIDQAINHMGSLNKLGDALQNGDVKAVNAVVNVIKDQTGNPSVNNFSTAKQAVGTELMRVFRQVNASEVETKAWEDRFKEANSPEQIKGALQVGVNLLNGRINAINNRWNRAMEVNTGYPNILSPEAQSVLQTLNPGTSGGSPAGKVRKYNPATRTLE